MEIPGQKELQRLARGRAPVLSIGGGYSGSGTARYNPDQNFVVALDPVFARTSENGVLRLPFGYDHETRSLPVPGGYFTEAHTAATAAYIMSQLLEADTTDPSLIKVLEEVRHVTHDIASGMSFLHQGRFIHSPSANGFTRQISLKGGGTVIQTVTGEAEEMRVIDRCHISHFHRAVYESLAPEASFVIEDFIGPGGFLTEEEVMGSLRGAGFVNVTVTAITHPGQTTSWTIQDNFRTREYGQPVHILAEKRSNGVT